MLQPKRQKYRKSFRPKTRQEIASRGNVLSFGEFGLRAETSGNISSRQIESARRAMAGFTKRGGRIWIRIFPDRVITKKPPEVTMGGGKGEIEGYVAPVYTGRVIFEMTGVPLDIAKEAMRLASHKLPIRSSFVTKEHV